MARSKHLVVLITGGTSGIGLALAQAFLKRGDKVAVCGRSDAALRSFTEGHPEALAVKADVTNHAERLALLTKVEERFGRLDILVNNAGTFVTRDFTAGNEPTAGLEEEIALNLTAPIQFTAEVLQRWPVMKAIVFVTSGYALVSPTRAPTYGAVKGGLHGFADGLRRQLAPKGIHVLELLPPKVDTPMNANVGGQKLSADKVALATLSALDRRKAMALPGVTRVLPLLLRLIPSTARRLIANSE